MDDDFGESRTPNDRPHRKISKRKIDKGRGSEGNGSRVSSKEKEGREPLNLSVKKRSCDLSVPLNVPVLHVVGAIFFDMIHEDSIRFFFLETEGERKAREQISSRKGSVRMR